MPAKPQKKQNPFIGLQCMYEGMPGLSWEAAAQFRGTARGFQVWSTHPDDEQSRLRRVDIVRVPLTWREAAIWLRGCGIGLGGDLTNHIYVYGDVEGHAADLLKMAWINFDNPFDAARDWLLLRSEADLRYLRSARGSFLSREGHRIVLWFKEALENLEWGGFDLRDVASRAGFQQGLPKPEELLRAIGGVDPASAIPRLPKDDPIYKTGWIVGLTRSTPGYGPKPKVEEPSKGLLPGTGSST